MNIRYRTISASLSRFNAGSEGESPSTVAHDVHASWTNYRWRWQRNIKKSKVIIKRKCRKLQKANGNFKVHKKKVCLMVKIASALKRRTTEELRTQFKVTVR